MSMKKYQLKSFKIEAVQLTKENAQEVADWCSGYIVQEINPTDANDKYVGINLNTRNGMQRISEGEYVIQNDKGQFFVSKPSIFEATYEEI